MMREAVRRIRAHLGHAVLLGALAAVAALIVTATPRLANELTDRGVRHDIAGLPDPARDIAFVTHEPFTSGHRYLREYGRRLPEPVRGAVGDSWYSAEVLAEGQAPFIPFNGLVKPVVGLRTQTGFTAAGRLTAGRWPDNRRPGDAIEVAVSGRVAGHFGLTVDSEIELVGSATRLAVRVVGLFVPIDPGAPFWSGAEGVLRPLPGPDTQPDAPPRALLLTDTAGVEAGAPLGAMASTWRYRVDERRIHAGQVEALLDAMAAVRRTTPSGLATVTSFDLALARFATQQRAVRALLAVVEAGIIATVLGLLFLAAALAAERRRTEYSLVRARGGDVVSLAGRSLTESLVATVPAVALGWTAGLAVPGRAPGDDRLVLVVAAVAALTGPALAVVAHRGGSVAATRRDLAVGRPSPRQVTLEVCVLLAAALGAVLLRRRGLAPTAGADLFLASVPVLLATAAAVVLLRALPPSLRVAGRLAAATRGAVAFVGLARVARSAPAAVGPLAVLVVAVTTGAFCAVVATTIAAGRDRATDAVVPADLVVTGPGFAPTTADDLGAVPGVDAVATMTVGLARPVLAGRRTGAQQLGQTLLVAVDAPSLVEVMRRSGVDADLPEEWTRAVPGAGPVPAVVSPEIAAHIAHVGDTAVTDLQGVQYEFRPAAVADHFPGLDLGGTRFVVLPRQALDVPADRPLVPTRFLLAGRDVDPDALRRVGDAGQVAWMATVTGTRLAEPATPTTVGSWRGHRAGLESSGVNGVLSFAFRAGAVGGVVLALLAVAFAVLAGARARGQVLSRLRTMGLSRRQSRSVLVFELGPLVLGTVLLGAVLGAALPAVLGPALGLSAFTAGVAARVVVDPVVVLAVVAVAVAGLATAVGMEILVNRRLRLGTVLRLGEDM
jgi:putative ABC transport system permease protein